MSETKWTKEQLEAITEKDCNLLVAAAAGAGKTAVLVERIIRKITLDENPTDIDKLLIVTFTNAAATEMRERIADAISKALDKNPNSTLLQRQLTLLNKANIMTIHSFCLDVIKNNFHYIDLNPGFRIADETETILLKIEALDNLFEEIYSEENIKEEFFDLLESYGGNRDDQALKDMVLSLYEFIQSYPWPNQWLEEKANSFKFDNVENVDFSSTLWGRILLENAAIELMSLKEMMGKAITVIETTKGLEPYLDNFREEQNEIDSLLKKCRINDANNDMTYKIWDDLYESFQKFGFKRLSSCKKDVDKTQQEYVRAIRDNVKKQIKKLQEDIFAVPSREVISDLQHVHKLLKHLCELVQKFEIQYKEQKRNKSLLDFNDLEHFCLEILTERSQDGKFVPSNVAREYRDRFEEILIDEYQDSNMVQEIILNAISKKDTEKPNVFMVGDVKQSIYRFRQAKPELFLEKYNTYSTEKGRKFRKILLYKNFRSRKKVIDIVNFIFSRIMSKEVGELDYDDNEALNFGAYYEESNCSYTIGGNAELHLLEMETNDDESTHTDTESDIDSVSNLDEEVDSMQNYQVNDTLFGEEPMDNIKSEARVVAENIKNLMGSFGVYDKKTKDYRSIEYRDIVILLRSTRNWSDAFVEELSLQSIPVYADTGVGFFKTTEVQIILSLLQIIDNPLQDIPLLSVLRAPFAGFTPDELADIRLADKESTLYDALVKICSGDSELNKKACSFIETLEKWRDKALYMSTDQLIWYLYTETGFYSYVGAMPGGEQRQANLRMLFEQARKFEETSYKGLFNFVNFINKIKTGGGDMGSAKILGENENVVRIMSIHKSKGLEFPVVFVSGCGKGFNMQDLNKSIILHQELGFGPNYVDYEKRITYPTLAKQALRYQIKKESLSEEMRILYVAFTRAREKLILTGTVKNLTKSVSRWKEYSLSNNDGIPSYTILRGKNYLDWICPALMHHEGYNFDIESNESDGSIVNNVRIWRKESLVQSTINSQTDNANEDNNKFDNTQDNAIIDDDSNNEEIISEILRRLNWEYKYKEDINIPVKISVTELKRRFVSEFSEEYPAYQVYSPTLIKKPAFLEESKGLNNAEIGTIFHFVMQHLDLKLVGNTSQIKSQIDGMISSRLLTEQQASYVNVNQIFNFFTSDLGKRMLNAAKVYREVPFNMQISSNEIKNQLKKLSDEFENDKYNEKVLLQGVIDCFFEENDGLVLLDYKTDYIHAHDGKQATERIKQRYKMQIHYYTIVLEKLLNRKVKEKYIYLFYNGETLNL